MLHFKRGKRTVRQKSRGMRGYVPEPLFWKSKAEGGATNRFFDASVVDIASGKVLSGLWTPWVAGGRDASAKASLYTGLSGIDRGLILQALTLVSRERCVILGGRRQSVLLLLDHAEESSTVAAVTLPYTVERLRNAMVFLEGWSCPIYPLPEKASKRKAAYEEAVVQVLYELMGEIERMRESWRLRLKELGCPMAYSPQ